MKNGQKRGRPARSCNVRVIPEFRKEPDIDKLGRALIAITLSIAEKKKAREHILTKTDEGDAMP
jgi:hypothetical protein